MVELSPELKQAMDKAAASIVTLDELREDPSEENMKNYVEGLITEMEEEDPATAEILKMAPGQLVDRRRALAENIIKTLRVRLEGLEKGYIDEEKFMEGVRKIIRTRLDTYSGKKAA